MEERSKGQNPLRLTAPLLLLLIAMLYFGTARLGLLLALDETSASPVWPPSGLAFAAMLLLGYRIWPGILLGALLANYTGYLLHQPGQPDLLPAFLLAIGNTLEAVIGTWLLRRLVPQRPPFGRVSDSFCFMAAALLMCLVSAGIGPLSLCATGMVPWALYSQMGFTWWLG
ncbi:MAG TPA: MASE1 domain-containing protein, partial [Candidatus Obscuribacterales bacterium]